MRREKKRRIPPALLLLAVVSVHWPLLHSGGGAQSPAVCTGAVCTAGCVWRKCAQEGACAGTPSPEFSRSGQSLPPAAPTVGASTSRMNRGVASWKVARAIMADVLFLARSPRGGRGYDPEG